MARIGKHGKNERRTFSIYTNSGRNSDSRPESWFQDKLAYLQDVEGGAALLEYLMNAAWYYENGNVLGNEESIAQSPINEKSLIEKITAGVLAGLRRGGVDVSTYQAPASHNEELGDVDEALAKYLGAEVGVNMFANLEIEDED